MPTTLTSLCVCLLFIVPGYWIADTKRGFFEYSKLTNVEFIIQIANKIFTIVIFWFLSIIFLNFNLKKIIFKQITNNCEILQNKLDFIFFLKNNPKIVLIVVFDYFYSIFCLFIFSYYYYLLEINLFVKKVIFPNTKKTDHLTPWDDFFATIGPSWVTVELKSKEVILGIASIASNHPFEKELIITGNPFIKDDIGVQKFIKQEDGKLQEIENPNKISSTYISFEDIETINLVDEQNIKKFRFTNLIFYLYIIFFLLLQYIVVEQIFIMKIFNYSYIYDLVIIFSIIFIVLVSLFIYSSHILAKQV